MKKQLLKFVMILPSLFIWQGVIGQYCEGGPSSTADSNIESASITGDNATSISYTGCPGVTGVEDETAQAVEFTAGDSYTFNITIGTCSASTYGGVAEVWIDYNQNDVFDPSESIGTATIPGFGQGPVTEALTFTVPLTATGGTTRIRAMHREGGTLPLDPCENFTWGSVVDFTADITAATSTCPFPTGLTATATSQEDVDLSWTPGDTETTWNVEWGAPGFTPGTGAEIGSDVVTGTPALSIAGLDPDTDYDFYVQADCGAGDLSIWQGPASVFTGYCEPIYTSTSDYMTLFETSNAQQNFTYTASAFPQPNGYENLTASLSVEQFAGISFDFLTGFNPSTSNNTFRIWVDWNQDLEFDVSEEVYLNTQTGAQNGSIAIPGGIPAGTYVMRIRSRWGATVPTPCSSETWGSAIDVSLVVLALPSCPPPVNISLLDATGSTLEIEWDDLGSANDYTIEWGVPGFTPGTGDEIGSLVTTNLQELITGLDGNTTYDIYIQADCGSGDVSDWSSVATYTTECSIFTAPFTENFDGTDWVSGTGFNNAGDVLDQCWDRDPVQQTSNLFWGVRTGTTGTGSTGPNTDVSGTGNYLFIETSYGVNQDSALLFSPSIDLDGLVLPELTFSYHMYGASTGALGVDISTDNGQTWDNVWQLSGQQQTSGADPWLNANVILPNYIDDTIKIRFVGIRGTSFTGDLAIDEVSVDEGPACPGINDISITNVLSNEATASWNAAFQESEWEVEYDTTGFNLGDGNSDIVSDTFNVMTGLDPNTTYDVYVRAICGAGDSSVWIGPISFTTPCEIFPTPFIEDFNGSEWVSGTGFNNVGSEISQCWTNIPSAAPSGTQPFFWGTRTGTTSNAATGPSAAASGTGNYIYTEASNGSAGDSAVFDSPMIDLSMINDPYLTFSYHMYGAHVDSMNVQISNDGGNTFDSLLTIVGQQQNDNDDDWIDTAINLSNYINDTVVIRFWNIKNSFNDDIAIDQFSILSCIPDGGVDNEIDVCRLDESIDLNDQITINQGGGKWDFPANQSLITNESIFNVSTLPTGNYNVFYIVPGACEDDTTILTLNIFPPSSAGLNGTIQACRNQPINLFDGLNGNVDMGGDWYDPSGNQISGSQPTSSNIPGSFNYDYIVSNGVCPADTQFVEVIVGTCDWLSVGTEEMQEIAVFPNPATEVLNIVNGSNLEGLRIEMYDATGRLVLTDNKALANAMEATISIAHLETGAYTMRVRNNDGERVFKIIKQ